MSDYMSEREAAAEKYSTWTRHPLRCDGTTVETKHFSEDKNIAFKAGWDECLTDSSVVRRLVEALKFECGNRCAEENPCNAKENYRIYEAAVKDVTK